MHTVARLALGAMLLAFGHPEYIVAGEVGVCTENHHQGLLPRPHYEPCPEDPPWLPIVVQLHGHLGPWVVLGFRMGAAGRQALGAEGYFDIEVVATGPFDRPPAACFLDGVQIATGATWGKRNICWQPGDEVSLRMLHRPTGREVIVRPRKEVIKAIFEKTKSTSLNSSPSTDKLSCEDKVPPQLPAEAGTPTSGLGQPTSLGDALLPKEVSTAALPNRTDSEGRKTGDSQLRPGSPTAEASQTGGICQESQEGPASGRSLPQKSHGQPSAEIEALARRLALLPASELLLIEYP